LDLSPTRNGAGKKTDFNQINLLSIKKVINSFDKQIHQMSTPLHQQPNDNIIKGNH